MYKIGLSTCEKDGNKPLNDATFKAYSDAGLKAMEIVMLPQDYKNIDYANVKRLSDEYGVELWSYHLPFYSIDPNDPLDPSHKDKKVREKTIEYFKSLICKASNIGINKFVVHPSGEPVTYDERSERKECSKESLSILADIAAEYDSVIAVEDLPRSCLGNTSDEILEIIGANPKLRVCFDTNHLLHEDNADFIRKVGNKIVTMHVSDYNFVNEQHWLPGEGRVKWNGVIDALQEIGYNGAWIYEINFKCPDTIIRDRDLTCQDFYKNAVEIFERKPITVISKHKDIR